MRQWVAVEGLNAHDVAVLVAKRPKAHCYELLGPRLTAEGIRWVSETHSVNGAVLLETFSRFKGLEAQAVVLWVGDEVVDEATWETVYVGTTRAKSLLAVVGSNRAVRTVREFIQAAG
ncbi:ATP-binding domain-containing protein [Variovorax guangxiensis]|uniref:ATP-binding domain-containing protein n=1 Tax=Variovorax guangxiensis TaxID=1775474 RepID=UPI001405102C|nr:ATP-binding domain-containing protein [Variovorax guangxiensis]